MGNSIKHIYNVKSKNKCPLALFFMNILTQDSNKDAQRNLYSTKVSIEYPHKKKRGLPQCHNCQSYGHTRNNCHHEPKCVKCDDNHPANECSKDRHNPVKCALFNKEQIANFKGCPVYIITFKKTVSRVPTPNLKLSLIRKPPKIITHT